ncbi:hypothetical protein D3C71_1554750 [compost metagenome]
MAVHDPHAAFLAGSHFQGRVHATIQNVQLQRLDAGFQFFAFLAQIEPRFFVQVARLNLHRIGALHFAGLDHLFKRLHFNFHSFNSSRTFAAACGVSFMMYLAHRIRSSSVAPSLSARYSADSGLCSQNGEPRRWGKAVPPYATWPHWQSLCPVARMCCVNSP